MRSIKLASRTHEDWAGKFIDEDYYDILLDEDAEVFKPEGSLLLKLKKRILSPTNVAKAWAQLKGYNPATNNRGTASGQKVQRRVRKDGTLSNTTQAEENVTSGLIGYFERTSRFPFCRACAFNLKYPEKFAQILPLFQEVSQLFSTEVPDRYLRQKEIVEKTSPDFVIPGTVFTTVTVNKNFRCACHLDAGDFEKGISALSLFREGVYSGGYLCFPDFRVAVKLDNADVIFFDPHEFHGNTPITAITEKYTRCTMVYYYREKMLSCGTNEEELNRVKNRKKGEVLNAK